MDWLNSTEILNLLNPTTVVNEVGIWFIIAIFGAFFGVVWWIIKQIINKKEQKKEKRELTERLLSEIKGNQDQLRPFSECVKLLDHDIEKSEDDKFPNVLNFKIGIYEESKGRFRLLDYDSRTKIYEYYPELEVIAKGYLKLNIHESLSRNGQKINKGLPFSHLYVLDFNKQLGKHNNLSEILEFLRNAKKEYDLGEELIKDLKE